LRRGVDGDGGVNNRDPARGVPAPGLEFVGQPTQSDSGAAGAVIRRPARGVALPDPARGVDGDPTRIPPCGVRGAAPAETDRLRESMGSARGVDNGRPVGE
jgi:hypothetical protein